MWQQQNTQMNKKCQQIYHSKHNYTVITPVIMVLRTEHNNVQETVTTKPKIKIKPQSKLKQLK